MKKTLSMTAALLAVLMLATACGNNNDNNNSDTTDESAVTTAAPDDTTAPTDDTTAAPAGDTIEGDPLELLTTLVSDAKIEIMSDTADLAAENVEWLLGLSTDDYNANVEKGAISMAMMTAQAHMVALLKCNDADAAQTIKEKLQTQFDIRRWVCVIPEMCYAIDSGSYVLFVASRVTYGESLLEGFTALAKDNVGERLDVEGATGKTE